MLRIANQNGVSTYSREEMCMYIQLLFAFPSHSVLRLYWCEFAFCHVANNFYGNFVHVLVVCVLVSLIPFPVSHFLPAGGYHPLHFFTSRKNSQSFREVMTFEMFRKIRSIRIAWILHTLNGNKITKSRNVISIVITIRRNGHKLWLMRMRIWSLICISLSHSLQSQLFTCTIQISWILTI